MAYFEFSIVNGLHDYYHFDIQCNPDLYEYLVCHDNAHGGEDWFDITLNEEDVEKIKHLCKTNEEKELIEPNIGVGTVIDVLIHHTILIKEE